MLLFFAFFANMFVVSMHVCGGFLEPGMVTKNEMFAQTTKAASLQCSQLVEKSAG